MLLRRWWIWFVALGCGVEGGASDTTAATGTTGSTATSEVVPTSSTGDTTATGMSTSESTGDPAVACDPSPEALPEAQFAEIIAVAICDQKAACGCAGDLGCAQSFLGPLVGVRNAAQDQGYAYDGVCAARLLNALVQHPGCALASEFSVEACGFDRCAVYQGNQPIGEACAIQGDYLNVLLAPDCEPSAYCTGTVCAAAPVLPTVADGQPCFDPMVGMIAGCMGGSGCDVGDTDRCGPLVEVGASCLGPGLCLNTLYCTDKGVCAPLGVDGAACANNSQCGSSRCTEGACEDRVWICEVAVINDLYTRNPETL